jgi:hypothetical protein
MSVSRKVTVPAGSSAPSGSPGPAGDGREAPMLIVLPAKLSLSKTYPASRVFSCPSLSLNSALEEESSGTASPNDP